jgi:hypothetical protein
MHHPHLQISLVYSRLLMSGRLPFSSQFVNHQDSRPISAHMRPARRKSPSLLSLLLCPGRTRNPFILAQLEDLPTLSVFLYAPPSLSCSIVNQSRKSSFLILTANKLVSLPVNYHLERKGRLECQESALNRFLFKNQHTENHASAPRSAIRAG